MNTTKTIDVDFDLTFADLYKATLAISIYVLRYLIWGIAIIAALFFGVLSYILLYIFRKERLEKI